MLTDEILKQTNKLEEERVNRTILEAWLRVEKGKDIIKQACREVVYVSNNETWFNCGLNRGPEG